MVARGRMALLATVLRQVWAEVGLGLGLSFDRLRMSGSLPNQPSTIVEEGLREEGIPSPQPSPRTGEGEEGSRPTIAPLWVAVFEGVTKRRGLPGGEEDADYGVGDYGVAGVDEEKAQAAAFEAVGGGVGSGDGPDGYEEAEEESFGGTAGVHALDE